MRNGRLIAPLQPRWHQKDLYADAHGYFVARFDRDRCDVEFVTVEEPVVLPEEGQASVRRRVKFWVDAWTNDESPELQLKGVSGKRPLGGLRS